MASTFNAVVFPSPHAFTEKTLNWLNQFEGPHSYLDRKEAALNEPEPSFDRCSTATREDRRGAPRQSTFLMARVALQSGPQVPCIVRDVSRTGLKLSIASSVHLPTTFLLHVTRWERDLDCELRWRSGEMAGVKIGRRILTSVRDCMAFVVAADAGEHYAASAVLKRCGYLVHRARSVAQATSSLLSMGADHPLLRREHLLFIVMEHDQVGLRTLRAASPKAIIIVASDDPEHAQDIDVRVPRCFTAPQLSEALNCVADLKLRPLRLARLG